MTVFHVQLTQKQMREIQSERQSMTEVDKMVFMCKSIMALRKRAIDIDDTSEKAHVIVLKDGREVQYVKEVIPIQQVNEYNLCGLQDTLAFVYRRYQKYDFDNPQNNIPDKRLEYRDHPATNKYFVGTGISEHHVDDNQIVVDIFDNLRDDDYIDLNLATIAARRLSAR